MSSALGVLWSIMDNTAFGNVANSSYTSTP